MSCNIEFPLDGSISNVLFLCVHKTTKEEK